MAYVEWIPFTVVMLVTKEMMMTANTISRSINRDNFEAEGASTVSSVVRVMTLMCHRTELIIWI